MTLRLVYRLYGGEKMKGRPPFYSKTASLASFLQAAEIANGAVSMLADGPIPDDLRSMMAGRGPVIDLPGGPIGMRDSFIAGLRYPTDQGWPDDDVVYFCEDDYLHDPQAFVALSAAASAIPSAGYFALYASTPVHPAMGPNVPFEPPADWVEHPSIVVAGQRWVNVPSTASTFGARVGVLKTDFSIFRQGMIPYPSRYLDHEICMVYQGRLPYTAKEIVLGPPSTRFRTGVNEFAANAFLSPFRLAFQLRALTRRRRPHLLYAADPNLACHLETKFMSPGVDWTEHARSAEAWATQAGFPVDTPS